MITSEIMQTNETYKATFLAKIQENQDVWQKFQEFQESLYQFSKSI